MSTDKMILEKNETEANIFVRHFLLLFMGIGLLIWLLCVFNIIKEYAPMDTCIIFGSMLITSAVVMLVGKLAASKGYTKYIAILTLVFDMFIISYFVVRQAWAFMLLPIVISIRYYDNKFTAVIGIVDAIAFALGFYTSEYSILFLGMFAAFIGISIAIAYYVRKVIVKQQRAALGAIGIKEKLNNDRLSLLSSQVQSHFINNSLNTICYLCEDDPEEASKAVADFASYLRANLNILNHDDDVTFSEALTHTKTYVDLEKRRFGDKLNVSYDTPVTGFMLPALTLQPIVENAIKHGICDRMRGGRVSVTTSEEDNAYKIVVKDDGVGFDVYLLDKEEYQGIGINSIKTRLKSRLGGKIEVISEPGIGTEVTITIPKESN